MDVANVRVETAPAVRLDIEPAQPVSELTNANVTLGRTEDAFVAVEALKKFRRGAKRPKNISKSKSSTSYSI